MTFGRISPIFCVFVLFLYTAFCNPMVSMSLLDDTKAPLVANLDMSNIKSYIDTEIDKLEQKLNETFWKNVGTLISNDKDYNMKFEDLENKIQTSRKTHIIKDCMDVARGTSGVYRIYPQGGTGYNVYCDMETDGGGWLVVQRRFNGEVNFEDKLWDDYKNGFGDVAQEHWLGNERLHHLTSTDQYELRIDLLHDELKKFTVFAKYKQFSVGNEDSKYALTIGNFTGNKVPSIITMNGLQDFFERQTKFTTPDIDNIDNSSLNCADSEYFEQKRGGWWFLPKCETSYLNGQYRNGMRWSYMLFYNRHAWLMRESRMMIRRL
ncbi:fibrinogen-like protein A [Mytilus californianus]|uniref:fibrinogen-like protein A n=1 Tax=Mytilus californianus TaxID=6549 RepID=UPI002246B6A4|nr:fibrinogen-like protein A [Mytilus californianus]